MKLFGPEGPLMSALETFADLVFCNVLFRLFSLPLFTIGASAPALLTRCPATCSASTGLLLQARFNRAETETQRKSLCDVLKTAWLLSAVNLHQMPRTGWKTDESSSFSSFHPLSVFIPVRTALRVAERFGRDFQAGLTWLCGRGCS